MPAASTRGLKRSLSAAGDDGPGDGPLATAWCLGLRWMSPSRCSVALARVAFRFWRRKSWEGEARRNVGALKSATNRGIHVAWFPPWK